MADEQIVFNFVNDTLPPYSPGAINVVKIDEGERRASMYVDLQSMQWQIKPEYSWDEINNKPPIDELATESKEGLMAKEDKILLNYFNVTKTTVDGVSQLNISVKS